MPALYLFCEKQDNIDVVALTVFVDLSGKSLQMLEKQTS